MSQKSICQKKVAFVIFGVKRIFIFEAEAEVEVNAVTQRVLTNDSRIVRFVEE